MKKFSLIILLILSFVSILVFFILKETLFQSLSKDLTAEKSLFLIEKGDSVFQIGENLEQRGFIKNKYVFDCYIFFNKILGKQTKLQAGEYSLSPSMKVSEIVFKISSGDVVKGKITIIEGWNLRDIGWYFENKGLFQAEELYERTDLEGYLFPDTYEIKKGTSLDEIVQKMIDNFNKKLTLDLREEIQNQGKTIPEITTMASLLEKEVITKEDKKIIAGILWKRLEIGMPLQVDATITYITHKQIIKVSKEDTQIDSPYNTYKYRGLPIGPICNPGLDSIEAAVYSENTQYWYYLSTPEGETIFSKTLEEHNLAKAKYLNNI